MSCTYSIICPSRKLKIWVGQKDYLYGDHLPALARFLHETHGEQLRFVNDLDDDDEAYECEGFEGQLSYGPE